MEQQKKLALITDAMSGIGFELARIFAKNDFDLIIAGESVAISDRARILRQYEVDVTSAVVDLSTEAGMSELYSKINRPVDVAIFNAGTTNPGEFIRTNLTGDLKLMNMNLVYMVGLSKKILQDMAIRDEGRILFTSSLAAEVPGSNSATFAAAQSFLQTFVKAIRFEMKEAKKKVKVTFLQSMPTDSDFFAAVAQQGFDALMGEHETVIGESLENKVRKTATGIITEERNTKSRHGPESDNK